MVVFSVWLAAFKFNQDYDLYDIVFQGRCAACQQGGEVHFNGIKVGEVTGISLDTVEPTQVIARARVTADVPIRVDSYATLEPQGITGVNYVQITAGTPLQAAAEAQSVPEGTRAADPLRASAPLRLAGRRRHVLARAIEALDRVNRVLSEDNIKRLSGMLDNVEVVTAELRERKAIIADAQRALQSADRAAQQVGELAASGNALINGDGRQTHGEAGQRGQRNRGRGQGPARR